MGVLDSGAMHETSADLTALQQLIDRTMAEAGPHLRSIVGPERCLNAPELVERLNGMCLLAVATATEDGRPLVGPVDGYFLRGSFHFSSARNSVKMRHLSRRPAVSALYLPGQELSVTVHGIVELYEVNAPTRPLLRQAMLEHYLPLQGHAFQEWLDEENPKGARIVARRIVPFCMVA